MAKKPTKKSSPENNSEFKIHSASDPHSTVGTKKSTKKAKAKAKTVKPVAKKAVTKYKAAPKSPKVTGLFEVSGELAANANEASISQTIPPRQTMPSVLITEPEADAIETKVADLIVEPKTPVQEIKPQEQLAANYSRGSANTNNHFASAPGGGTRTDESHIQPDVKPTIYSDRMAPAPQPVIDNVQHIQTNAVNPTIPNPAPAVTYNAPVMPPVNLPENNAPVPTIPSGPAQIIVPQSTPAFLSEPPSAVTPAPTQPVIAAPPPQPIVPAVSASAAIVASQQPVAPTKTAADFPANYVFQITTEDLSPGLPIVTFNNKSITAAPGHKLHNSGPLTFDQNGFFGDGVTPFFKQIQFPDPASHADFFNQLVNMELNRSVKQNMAQNLLNKILTADDIDTLIKVLPAGPPPEAVSKVDPNLASLLQQKNNSMANGQQQEPPRVFTNKDFIEQMRSYGKTLEEAITQSIPARFHGGLPQAQVQELFARSLKQYKYELKNDGPGFYIKMNFEGESIRVPETEGQFLPIV